jgi:chromosome partitioning protein
VLRVRFDGRKILIRGNIILAEAPSFRKSILKYRPDSHGAEDYLALCREIIEREAK